MQISEHKLVRVDYELTTGEGVELENSSETEPLEYVHGTETLLPKLEESLEGHVVGDKLHITLEPEFAYGVHDPELVHVVERTQFPAEAEIEVGMAVSVTGPQGELTMAVAKVEPQAITLDGNHPLAGVTLVFKMKVTEVREATPAEVERALSAEDQESPED